MKRRHLMRCKYHISDVNINIDINKIMQTVGLF